LKILSETFEYYNNVFVQRILCKYQLSSAFTPPSHQEFLSTSFNAACIPILSVLFNQFSTNGVIDNVKLKQIALLKKRIRKWQKTSYFIEDDLILQDAVFYAIQKSTQ